MRSSLRTRTPVPSHSLAIVLLPAPEWPEKEVATAVHVADAQRMDLDAAAARQQVRQQQLVERILERERRLAAVEVVRVQRDFPAREIGAEARLLVGVLAVGRGGEAEHVIPVLAVEFPQAARIEDLIAGRRPAQVAPGCRHGGVRGVPSREEALRRRRKRRTSSRTRRTGGRRRCPRCAAVQVAPQSMVRTSCDAGPDGDGSHEPWLRQELGRQLSADCPGRCCLDVLQDPSTASSGRSATTTSAGSGRASSAAVNRRSCPCSFAILP